MTDRDILRDLARRVRALADDPVNDRKRRLWRDLNALRKRRPMVRAFPEGDWSERNLRSRLFEREPIAREKIEDHLSHA